MSNYLSLTHPDIAYSVSIMSQFMHVLTQQHLKTVHHILGYLRGTSGKGLLFRKTDERWAEGFYVADWAGSVVDSRSTSGFCTKLWGNLVTWRSKK